MKKLELYYFPECPYCQFVLKTIQEQNLKKEITFCNTRENRVYGEKLLKDTGRRTVPCLYIDGIPMHESEDIAKWLVNYAKNKG